MKTAISVPNDVYLKAEQLARRAGKSRSEVYSAALREYVARHSPDEVTGALDRVMEGLGEDGDADRFPAESAKQTLRSTEW